MPLYEVFHLAPLAPAVQDELAAAITKIHTTQFGTPAIFVNVIFHEETTKPYYVGGRKTRLNRILAHVRTGPSRTQADYDTVTAKLIEAWRETVNGIDTSLERDKETGAVSKKVRESLEALQPHDMLSTVFILGDVIAAHEKGFNVPPAGHDSRWVRDNIEAFKQKARAGDEDWAAMLEDIKTREEFADLFPEDNDPEMVEKAKTRASKLEQVPSYPDDAQTRYAIRLASDPLAAQQKRESEKEKAEQRVNAENSV